MPATPQPPLPDAPAAVRLGYALRLRRQAMPGIRSREQLAERLGYSVAVVKAVENGVYPAGLDRFLTRWEDVFGLDPELHDLWAQARFSDRGHDLADATGTSARLSPAADWTADAIELLREVEQTDVGQATLEAIDRAVDLHCRAYASTPPPALRQQVRQHLTLIRGFLDGRLTLAQRRHLLAAAGWLSLLLACLHFDVGQRQAAEVNRATAFALGDHTGHAELMAWALETKAWFALANGNHREATDAARAGEDAAPAGTSALVAVTMQQARAWANRQDRHETHGAIRRAAAAMETVPAPEHPEHHFVFDPPKISFYAATSYVLLGAPDQAEEHARRVINECGDPDRPNYWPTRVATTRVELGLVHAQRRDFDAAAVTAAEAFDATFLRRSTLWRAADLDRILARQDIHASEVRDFRERFALAKQSLAAS